MMPLYRMPPKEVQSLISIDIMNILLSMILIISIHIYIYIYIHLHTVYDI